jgi:hypothetical protein
MAFMVRPVKPTVRFISTGVYSAIVHSPLPLQNRTTGRDLVVDLMVFGYSRLHCCGNYEPRLPPAGKSLEENLI